MRYSRRPYPQIKNDICGMMLLWMIDKEVPNTEKYSRYRKETGSERRFYIPF
jgi:hypothetical protein